MAEYEFSSLENQGLMRLHRRLLLVSVALLAFGAILGVDAFALPRAEQTWVQLLGGLAFISLGIVFFRPLDNLKRIATKTGSDISELMTAMGDLRVAFASAAVLFGVMAALTALGIIRILTM